ncbi:ankyrin unc44 [Colletotrichum tofieldiae]|uniref:Ankyrin unc44 n=1 Tax=Colletotrichum tofieldiae TaxID=708197 RepID=A0A166MEP3_9PEZI|nr:ankyrin unc44 [Colletotrichum tofieldiae]
MASPAHRSPHNQDNAARLCNLPPEISQAIAAALVRPRLPSLRSKSTRGPGVDSHVHPHTLPSSGLRDVAALASTSRKWYLIANPLLHTASLALDHFASQTLPSQQAILADWRQELTQVVTAADLFRDPWSSVRADNQPVCDCEPLLFWAASSGRLDLLQRLLSYGPEWLHEFWEPQDSSRPDGDGNGDDAGAPSEPCFATFLHAAARAGQDDVIEWILAQAYSTSCWGPLPAVDIDAEAQLVCLCPSPHLDVGDWDESLGVGASPLHLALTHGHHSTAKVLMRHGAVWDRSFSFSAGVTGLHIMTANGATDLACLAPNSGGGDADEVEGEGDAIQHQDARAARLVSSLLGLGAILETQNRQEAARRLESERQRLGGSHRQALWAYDGIDPHWTYRLAYWEQDMEQFEFLQMEPAAFSAARGNQSTTRALQAAVDRQRRDGMSG